MKEVGSVKWNHTTQPDQAARSELHLCALFLEMPLICSTSLYENRTPCFSWTLEHLWVTFREDGSAKEVVTCKLWLCPAGRVASEIQDSVQVRTALRCWVLTVVSCGSSGDASVSLRWGTIPDSLWKWRLQFWR